MLTDCRGTPASTRPNSVSAPLHAHTHTHTCDQTVEVHHHMHTHHESFITMNTYLAHHLLHRVFLPSWQGLHPSRTAGVVGRLVRLRHNTPPRFLALACTYACFCDCERECVCVCVRVHVSVCVRECLCVGGTVLRVGGEPKPFNLRPANLRHAYALPTYAMPTPCRQPTPCSQPTPCHERPTLHVRYNPLRQDHNRTPLMPGLETQETCVLTELNQ
jgi:hypothetical protein